ncbi:hypothetical protein L6R52_36100 [Myxococcota bacterium]|nr:hypothetical protein [Myxococcota bacterium]
MSEATPYLGDLVALLTVVGVMLTVMMAVGLYFVVAKPEKCPSCGAKKLKLVTSHQEKRVTPSGKRYGVDRSYYECAGCKARLMKDPDHGDRLVPVTANDWQHALEISPDR